MRSLPPDGASVEAMRRLPAAAVGNATLLGSGAIGAGHGGGGGGATGSAMAGNAGLEMESSFGSSSGGQQPHAGGGLSSSLNNDDTIPYPPEKITQMPPRKWLCCAKPCVM